MFCLFVCFSADYSANCDKYDFHCYLMTEINFFLLIMSNSYNYTKMPSSSFDVFLKLEIY